jgi:Condensation domain
MSTQEPLSDRVARLRQRTTATASSAIPAAGAISGTWGQNCQAFPASYAQSRLWFLHQLHPDLTAYQAPSLWQLTGELNLRALRLALADLIERHPTLRTSFQLQGSDVVQVIRPPGPFPLDAEPLSDRNPDAVLEEWLCTERTTPFDLGAGLLLRARLLAVNEQQHVLLINHHHIASDGWSRSVLAQDLTALYNARCTARTHHLQRLLDPTTLRPSAPRTTHRSSATSLTLLQR